MSDLQAAHVNGLQLVYRAEGDPGAPPMILIHGRTGEHLDWGHFIGHFAQRYRVYAPDLRGHGLSDWPGDYSVALMSDDVLALLDHLGVERAVVVGHSLGGMVGYDLATRHPERVERLVLEDAPVPLAMERPPLQEDDSDNFDWRMVHGTERDITAPGPAWWEGLATLPTPTLVVSGGPTSHLPYDRTVAMAERLPHGRLVTIDVGHLVHDGDPQAFREAVEEFLAG